MSEVDDILESLEQQVTGIMLHEQCSFVEDRLANALAVLIATLRHERAQKPDMGTTPKCSRCGHYGHEAHQCTCPDSEVV